MADYKILFWNIQNVYEYKAVRPNELQIESQISEPPAKRQKKIEDNAKKLYETKSINHRETVVNIIREVDPDIVAIAELAVGKVDLSTGQVSSSSQICYDNFVITQLQVSLNSPNISSKNIRKWESSISSVNASSIIATANASGLNIQHKNSMFEQYGVLWDANKLKIQTSKVDIVDQDRAGNPITFKERKPGFVKFADAGTGQDLFSLAIIHSVYGGSGNQAIQQRSEAIEQLSRVKEMQDAINNDPKRLVIAGDFNLDYKNQSSDYLPLTGKSPAGLGMTAVIEDQKTCRVFQSPNDLTNAYDQIFTRGFTNNSKASGVYNFVEELLFGDYKLGAKISDHLPVYVVVEI